MEFELSSGESIELLDKDDFGPYEVRDVKNELTVDPRTSKIQNIGDMEMKVTEIALKKGDTDKKIKDLEPVDVQKISDLYTDKIQFQG